MFYNYKSTFICVLAQKATEFREQNSKHLNFISFNLINNEFHFLKVN